MTTVVWTNLSSIVYGNISCITSAAKKQLPKIEPMKYMDHQSEFGSGKNGNKTGRGVARKRILPRDKLPYLNLSFYKRLEL